MSTEEGKKLQKEVRKAKRIATEWASQLHDLVEDRLPAAFEEIPEIAQSTYNACQAWREASDKLEAFEASQTAASPVEAQG